MWYLEQLMWARASSSLWYVPSAWQRHMADNSGLPVPRSRVHECLTASSCEGHSSGWGAGVGCYRRHVLVC